MASDENEILLSPEWEYPQFNYGEINHPDSSSKFSHLVEIDYGLNHGKFVSTADNSKFFVNLRMQGIPNDIAANIVPERTLGWKFHVSIDDTDPENIEKGWNLVKEILIRERVYISKVVSSVRQMVETQDLARGEQRGKQITIYTAPHRDRGLEAWSNLVSEITRVLAQNGIAPSYRPEGDEQIEGSNYVSFRYDGYYDEKHAQDVVFNRVEDWREQLQNVRPGEIDQFKAGIQINPPVPNQAPNPIWEPPSSISKCCPM